jgi:hypothetical protein
MYAFRKNQLCCRSTLPTLESLGQITQYTSRRRANSAQLKLGGAADGHGVGRLML